MFLSIRRVFRRLSERGVFGLIVNPEERGLAVTRFASLLGVAPTWDAVKVACQRRPSGRLRDLLSTSAKTEATEESAGAWNRVLYLAPHNMAGIGTVCPGSTPECRASCLNTSGHGFWDSVQYSRLCKTVYLYLWPVEFRARLLVEIRRTAKKAAADGKTLAVRLDGTSDLGLAEFMPPVVNVQYYDYTKMAHRARGSSPDWHVTLSARGLDHAKEMAQGAVLPSMALVVRHKGGSNANAKTLVKLLTQYGVKWWPGPIVNGDLHDARYLDAPGSLVLLSAKGDALTSDGDGFCWDATIFDTDVKVVDLNAQPATGRHS